MWPKPTAEEFAVLSSFERSRLSLHPPHEPGNLETFLDVVPEVFGAGWIHLATYNLMQVYGLENIARRLERPPDTVAANHRSFFDMYIVSTTLFRHTVLAQATFFSCARALLLRFRAGIVCESGDGLVVDVSAVFRFRRKTDHRKARL